MILPIAPKLNEAVIDLLRESRLLLDLKKLSRGPLHLLFPEMMSTNVQELRQAMADTQVDYRIFFAHKATKSTAFLKQALKLKLGIDVASKDELCHALAAGFRGVDAECTGVKNQSFLQLSLLHGCLLVADSIPEMERIVHVKRGLGIEGKLPLLVRLSDVSIPGRSMQSRVSRFGVPEEDFSSVLDFFRQNSELLLLGFHFHNDERESDIRAGQLEGLLNLMIDAYKAGLEPTVINIGGGLRRQQLLDANQWSEYIERLEENLIQGSNDNCWRGFAYGMRLNDRGKVVGRSQAIAMCLVPEQTSVVRDMFALGDIDGKSNADFIRDNGFKVLLEPGQALLEQCAISLFEIIEIRKATGGHMCAVVDGNMYNLSASMREYVMDPLLISVTDSPVNGQFECFIVGSLCREEDFLMKRKVQFDRIPQPGDLICFVNTAAYRIDFEDASPHQQPVGMRLVANCSAGHWQFSSEDTYDPFEKALEYQSTSKSSRELVKV